MSLQVRRGALAPTDILAAGEPYFDSTANILWLGDGAVNRPYIGYSDPDIKVADFTVPAITNDTRSVVEVVLGTLNNPGRALLGFFLDSAVDAEIQKMYNDFGAGNIKDAQILVPGNYTYPGIKKITNGYSFEDRGGNMLVASENHVKAQVFSTRSDGKYGDGAGTAMPDGFTYEDMGVGVLVGWYSIGSLGVLGLDKKVEMESVWITTVAGVTTLSIALYNRDAAPNTTVDFKVAVYE